MISDEHKNRFEKAGVSIFENEHFLTFLKKMGTKGNKVPGYITSVISSVRGYNVESLIEINSDCPLVRIEMFEDQFIVSVWNWVPGPGPGDFEKVFETEDEATNFAWSYFFGNNEYFEQFLQYSLNEIKNSNDQD